MLKRLLSVFLCMLMACALICTSALAAEDETVLPENDPDNGPAQIYIDEKPFGKMGDAVMIDSTVYVPMRNLCLSYGGVVAWDQEIFETTIILEDVTLVTRLWSNVIIANGPVLYDRCPSILVDGSMLVPARLLAKALNAQVSWDEENRIVSFVSGEEAIESADTYYNQDDLYWLSRIIFSEAGNQPLEGMIAVGNVVYNRVNSPLFPGSVYNVIFQRGQFCPVRTGAIYRSPSEASVQAAKIAMEGTNVVGDALFFQNTAITGSNWMSNTRPLIVELGDHTFYA